MEKQKNPYRNQIDYIMMKKQHRQFLCDARSYSGIEIYTDHRLVKAKLDIRWYKLKPSKTTNRIKIEDLNNQENKKKYQEKITEHLQEINTANTTAQEKWTNIVKVCTEAAEEVVGRKERSKKSENEDIKKLSEQQKKLRDDQNSTKKNKRKKEKIQRYRRREIRSCQTYIRSLRKKKLRKS